MNDTKSPYYPNLRAEMLRYGVTVEDVAAAVGISVSATWRRLTGHSPITNGEMRRIRDQFFPFATLDYLYDEKPAVVKPVTE